MFKLSPNVDGHDLKDSELKEAPLDLKGHRKVELTDFKQSVAWEATHRFSI